MKSANKVLLVTVLAGMVSLASSSANAMTASQQSAIEKSLLKTPAIELAAKAVEFVNKAVESDRKATAILVVRTAVTKNPASAPSVVSAVCSVYPELAPKLVAVVAEVAPDQAVATARTATRVAPDFGDQMMTEVAKVAPAKIAAAVGSAVSEEKSVIAKVNAQTESATTVANAGRAFPPGSGGIIRKTTIPINPRLVFSIIPPRNVSNYAAPGSDPNRP